jgi:hypothetical protein
MTSEQASAAILAGNAPSGLRVDGALSFYTAWGKQPRLIRLPDDLEVTSLTLSGQGDLRALPRGLRCDELTIKNSALNYLPADLQIRESLRLTYCPYLTALPYGLSLRQLELDHCDHLKRLPTGIQISDSLAITNCARLETLPNQLAALRVRIADCPEIRHIPADYANVRHLIIQRCVNLEYLPPLAVETLDLTGCVALRELPEGLRARSLTIARCRALDRWPESGVAGLRRLDMGGCWRLTSLPPGVRQYQTLDIRDCVALGPLPEHLRVTDWLDIGGLDLRALPLSARGFRLRWRGVPVNGRALFHPETLAATDALTEENAEIRRVMLERMGFERFIRGANAMIIHEDADPGGARQLLEVSLAGDENIRCLAVRDPSTGRQYMIRVPPWMRDCHQAAAWIAGFDNPDNYHPIAET